MLNVFWLKRDWNFYINFNNNNNNNNKTYILLFLIKL